MVLQPSICWGAPTAEAELCGLMAGCPPWRAGREVCAVLRRGRCTPHFLFGCAEKKTGRARSKRKAAIVQTFPMSHGESLGMRPLSRCDRIKLGKSHPTALAVGNCLAFKPHLRRGCGFAGYQRKGFRNPPVCSASLHTTRAVIPRCAMRRARVGPPYGAEREQDMRFMATCLNVFRACRKEKRERQ